MASCLVAASLGGCVGDFPGGAGGVADGAPSADGSAIEVPDGRGGAGGVGGAGGEGGGGGRLDLGRDGGAGGTGDADRGPGDGMGPEADAEVTLRPDFDPPDLARTDGEALDAHLFDGGPLDMDLPDALMLDAEVPDVEVPDFEVRDAEPSDGEPPLPWNPDPEAPLRWREIHAGDALSCGLRTDGRARCWGDLGGGDVRAAPADLRFSALSVHRHRGCGVVHPTGVVRCWGNGGQATDDLAAFREGGFSSVATGRELVCGLRQGALFCAGKNGTVPPAAAPFNDGITRFEAVAVGKDGGCALDRQGGVTCFGQPAGLLAVPDGRYAEVAVGEIHACAVVVPDELILNPATTVRCWGANDVRTIAPFGQITRIASTHQHTCGLSPAGVAACWGLGGGNRLGAHGLDYRQVSAGHAHNCAVNHAGVGFCWGQAGDYPAQNVPLPGSF